jgi:hypothetical protein
MGAPRNRRLQRGWVNIGSFETRLDGDRRVCANCGTQVRGYNYRFYPAESESYERCVGLAWCPGCKIYAGNMVYVARDVQIVDALAHLPADEREHLKGSDKRLVEYLDRHPPTGS